MKIRHFCLIVNDLESSIKFYEKVIGFTLITKKTIEGDYPERLLGIYKVKLTYAKFKIDESGVILELIKFHNPKTRPPKVYSHISLTVDNLDKEYERIKEAGVYFISKPLIAPDSGCKVCFCKDNEERLIELVEDKK
jgi:lactoylglutathione lyase